VPAALEAICLRCLRKQPAERYARAADLAEALRRWLADAPTDASPESVAAAAGPAPFVPPTTPTEHPPAGGWGRGRKRRSSRDLHPPVWLAAGLVLAALVGLGIWAWLRPTPPNTTPDGFASPTASGGAGDQPAKALTVRWRVQRYEPEGHVLHPRGVLGESTYSAQLKDRVEVEATLSEPAYAYLIAFNPADRPDALEQPLPRSEANRAPEKREFLSTEGWYNLTDGEGLQAFAVVASRQPLPSYAEWRKQRPPLPWKQTRALAGVVWKADGMTVRGLFGPVVDTRGEEEKSDKMVIRDLARALQGVSVGEAKVEAVSVLGFAVGR
jgi:hypothetical protein